MQIWRDKYEKLLDARPRTLPLEFISHWLTQFQYGKFHDIEMPGQYTQVFLPPVLLIFSLLNFNWGPQQDKDNNQSFARIVKFGQKYEVSRSSGVCWRRFSLHGSDNSVVWFTVQQTSPRHSRREDRAIQLFQSLNM